MSLKQYVATLPFIMNRRSFIMFVRYRFYFANDFLNLQFSMCLVIPLNAIYHQNHRLLKAGGKKANYLFLQTAMPLILRMMVSELLSPPPIKKNKTFLDQSSTPFNSGENYLQIPKFRYFHYTTKQTRSRNHCLISSNIYF